MNVPPVPPPVGDLAELGHALMQRLAADLAIAGIHVEAIVMGQQDDTLAGVLFEEIANPCDLRHPVRLRAGLGSQIEPSSYSRL